jgi:hypothetical protein
MRFRALPDRRSGEQPEALRGTPPPLTGDKLEVRLFSSQRPAMRASARACPRDARRVPALQRRASFRYLHEFAFRYSNRVKLGVNDMERSTRAIQGIERKRLTYPRTDGKAA